MKKKLVIVNLILMLSFVLALGYQSLHTFTHHKHTQTGVSFKKETTSKTTQEIKISEKEECPICDFKFTTFLSPTIIHYTLYSPFKVSPYSFSIKEATSFFCGSLFSHRGPPNFI
ncbi:hypothetical protein ACFS5J_08435 [Flavobacterium chuncheonense]|uniref:DUF2946 domain-containing protein n=1 Tax=Flavobacterium chuncheonense TaxID=2026653 RepID=A0ABW5YM59_9FLAO